MPKTHPTYDSDFRQEAVNLLLSSRQRTRQRSHAAHRHQHTVAIRAAPAASTRNHTTAVRQSALQVITAFVLDRAGRDRGG